MAEGVAKISREGSVSKGTPNQGDRKAAIVTNPVNTAGQFMIELRHMAQACVEISAWDSKLYIEICLNGEVQLQEYTNRAKSADQDVVSR